MTTSDFTFYTSAEYWAELVKLFTAAKAGDRIAMISMELEPTEPATAPVIEALMAAADRGVDVHMVIDAYSLLLNSDTEVPGPLWWQTELRYTPKPFRERIKALVALDAKPTGHATIINKPGKVFTNMMAGRSHIKYTIINDKIFVGGCNIYRTEWLDLMVEWRDKVTADYLFNLIREMHKTETTYHLFSGQDQEIAVDADTALYIDAGIKGQSIILKKALELIDSAEKSVIITCQYFPNSITARHLAAAHKRGVDVEIVYAHPTKQGRIRGLGQQVSILRERSRHPAELFQKMLPKNGPGLHAKLIATEKGAIIGSHNYVRAGVMLGTAEIAIMRYDASFAKQAIAALKRELTY